MQADGETGLKERRYTEFLWQHGVNSTNTLICGRFYAAVSDWRELGCDDSSRGLLTLTLICRMLFVFGPWTKYLNNIYLRVFLSYKINKIQDVIRHSHGYISCLNFLVFNEMERFFQEGTNKTKTVSVVVASELFGCDCWTFEPFRDVSTRVSLERAGESGGMSEDGRRGLNRAVCVCSGQAASCTYEGFPAEESLWFHKHHQGIHSSQKTRLL